MRGDISPTLAMKIGNDGKRTPIPHRRIQAVEPENGEVEVDNPNSGVVWHYSMFDTNGDEEIDFVECFNNDHQVTEHFHEFAMGLQTDEAGNFYYAKSIISICSSWMWLLFNVQIFYKD